MNYNYKQLMFMIQCMVFIIAFVFFYTYYEILRYLFIPYIKKELDEFV